MACSMYDGAVWIKGAVMRGGPPIWGTPMSPGESVRVRYVAATRMVSVVWRGRSYDLAVLPATADIAHMRFGSPCGSTTRCASRARLRVRAASASGVACDVCHCGVMFLTRRVCSRARATQHTTSCRTCDSSFAPACCARRDVPAPPARAATSWRGCASARRSGLSCTCASSCGHTRMLPSAIDVFDLFGANS